MREMTDPFVIRLPDPCLVVLMGAAGVGKSTFASRHFGAEEILSSDAYRGLVSGDPTDQRATGPAFAALHRALRERLRAGRLTVVDATNVTVRARAALLREAKGAGVPAVAKPWDSRACCRAPPTASADAPHRSVSPPIAKVVRRSRSRSMSAPSCA